MNKPEHIDRLKDLILDFLKNDNVKVLLFGSRARSDYSPGSDVDVAIIPNDAFDRRKLTVLRAHIEDSTIPYKVDIVDFSTLSEDFKQKILKEAIIWKD